MGGILGSVISDSIENVFPNFFFFLNHRRLLSQLDECYE